MSAEFQRVNMADESYQETWKEIQRSSSVCFKINHTDPMRPECRELLHELIPDIPETSNIMAPMQIDMGKNMKLGEHVFINHGLTVMARGGVEIEDGVMIGPNASILTANHDFNDHMVLLVGKVYIKKNAWIGANTSILAGVTIGENAVVAAGAVVTKDVPKDTVVGGNPARVIKQLGN